MKMKNTDSREREHKSLQVDLGKVIAGRRLAASITQLELAIAVGVTRSYLSDVERGLRNVTLNTLDHIATALNTTPGELLVEVEKLDKLRSVKKKRS